MFKPIDLGNSEKEMVGSANRSLHCRLTVSQKYFHTHKVHCRLCIPDYVHSRLITYHILEMLYEGYFIFSRIRTYCNKSKLRILSNIHEVGSEILYRVKLICKYAEDKLFRCCFGVLRVMELPLF